MWRERERGETSVFQNTSEMRKNNDKSREDAKRRGERKKKRKTFKIQDTLSCVSQGEWMDEIFCDSRKKAHDLCEEEKKKDEETMRSKVR